MGANHRNGNEGWGSGGVGGLKSCVCSPLLVCVYLPICGHVFVTFHWCAVLITPALLLLPATAKWRFNIWRPSDPCGNAYMCHTQRQNQSLSSWKAGFLNKHAGCWQFMCDSRRQRAELSVCLSVLKPVCVHQHSWLAGLWNCFDCVHLGLCV